MKDKLRELAERWKIYGSHMTGHECAEELLSILAQPAQAVDCPACEGRPASGNSPCHVCGKSAQAVDVRVVYELFQDGFCVAGSDDLSDALHYVSQYSQDGPVELRKVTCHSEIIDTAADGEG